MLAELAPAQAASCTGAVDAANSTTCTGGTSTAGLTYVGSNADYVDGDFTLTLDNHDVTAGGIVLDGIITGNGFIILENGSDVSNTSSEGIDAVIDGNLKITLRGDSTISGGNLGILADSASGTVEIVMEGGIRVSGLSSGILTDAAGDIAITTGVGSIVAGQVFQGIFANSNGGIVDILIGEDSTVSGGENGIRAKSTGAIVVFVSKGSVVTGRGADGIDAQTTGAGNISITNEGVAKGSFAGINATTETGTIGIVNTGTIRNESDDIADVAIRTRGGAATIDNNVDGVVRGRIETDGGGDVLNNSGIWISDGFNDFGDGGDAVNNSAVIFAGGEAGIADTTVFAGLETLNNSGGIALSDQLSRDGSNISDVLAIDGDYAGSGAAVLAVDASLGGPGSESDILVVGGNTSGVTRLLVNNTSLGPGGLNTAGILVVDVVGTAHEGDFVLADGPIDTGFFIYDLVFNNTDQDNDQFLLVSEADDELFEPLATVASSQEIWRETTDAWAARQQGVRDRLRTGVVVTAVADPELPGTVAPENGLWFTALGSWTSRGSRIAGFNVSYDQSIYGFAAGADFGVDTGDDGTLLFGVLAGYVDSSLDFDASPSSIKTDGATLGVYAGLLDGGFFANILIQADLLDLTFSAPELLSDTGDDADVVSIGARADIGYRFDDGGLFVEPMLSFDAVSTSIDALSLGGADIDPGSNESFRAGAGLRAGLAGERATASLTGRLWEVFATNNEVVFTAGGEALDLSDDGLEGLYGEVSGQVDIDLSSAALFFVKGGVLFSDDITKPSVSGGFTFTW